MSIFDFFKKPVPSDISATTRVNAETAPISSANHAKNRLQIIIKEDRNHYRQAAQKSLIAVMEKEIYLLVQKYIKISKEDMEVKLSQQDDKDVLELNIDIHGKEILDTKIVNSQTEQNSPLQPPKNHE